MGVEQDKGGKLDVVAAVEEGDGRLARSQGAFSEFASGAASNSASAPNLYSSAAEVLPDL